MWKIYHSLYALQVPFVRKTQSPFENLMTIYNASGKEEYGLRLVKGMANIQWH